MHTRWICFSLCASLVGCFTAKFQDPDGARYVVADFTSRAKRTFTCDHGDVLTLFEDGGSPRLHVASSDLVISNQWVDVGKNQHFFYGFAYQGVEYVIPAGDDSDALVASYADVGGHAPEHPDAKLKDGSPPPKHRPYGGYREEGGAKQPIGDPYTRDVCWSSNGPLAKQASALGIRPRDLLYFHARPQKGVVPVGAQTKLDVGDCVGGGTIVGAPVEGPFYLVTNGSHTTLHVAPLDAPGLRVEDEAAAACPLPFADGSCHGSGEKAVVFYWEHVANGYEVVWNATKDVGALTIYAPGDLRSGAVPPEKKALAGPLSPEGHVIGCVLKRDEKFGKGGS